MGSSDELLVASRLLAAVAGASIVLAFAVPAAQAADVEFMLDKCRRFAAKHLNVSTDIVNVKYEGQRTDKTHAVNGSTESAPPLTFQCSFRADGQKVASFVFHAPEGCPADVSEADRYKYPDCD